MRVIVEPYNPQWPVAFDGVKASLDKSIDGIAGILGIEHVGSTAVPGLAAKPVLDIDIVSTRPAVPLVITALEKSGYIYYGTWGIPDRHALRIAGQDPPVNLYVCIEDSISLRNHLSVRDLLRKDEALREEYGAVKMYLARKEWDNVNAYSVAKNEIVGKLLARAGMGENELRDIESVNVWPWGAGVRDDTDRNYLQGGNKPPMLKDALGAQRWMAPQQMSYFNRSCIRFKWNTRVESTK